MKPRQRLKESGGIELLEESVELLRNASAEAWAIYLAGAVPFIAGLLWYAADMSRSAFARQGLFEYSLGITLLFIGKQVSESYFLARLHAALTGVPVGGSIMRTVLRQMAVQPWALLAIPLAILATVPLPSVVFFFRGFSLLTVTESAEPVKCAWKLARLAQGQAWVLFSVLFLFSLLLYVNLLAGTVVLLMLSKSVFGVENLIAQPMVLLRSSTLHFGIFLAAWACGDLVLGAATVLRCFRGDSIKTGADIRSMIRHLVPAALLVALLAAPVFAAPDQASLDKSIDETLRQREFSWRMPSDEEQPAAVNWFVKLMRSIGDAFESFLNWLDRMLRPDNQHAERDKQSQGGGSSLRYLMIALAAVAAGAALLIYIRSTRKRPAPTAAESTTVRVVDVHDESVLADQLEEDSWLRMADDLIAKGDYRAALRALHLSGLRFLAERRLVNIQRWKSGLEYHDELRRRARHAPALNESFLLNLRLFEYGWYSRHSVNPPMLDEFRRRLGEIRTQAGAP